MKRKIALVLALCFVVSLLASCGSSLSGTYTAESFGSKLTYTFSGNDVKLSVSVFGMQAVTVNGTYKIDGNSITLTFGGEEAEAKQYSGTFDFAKGEDGKTITIGLVTYEKQ